MPHCTNLSCGIWFEGAANFPTAIQTFLQISPFLQGLELSRLNLLDERGLWVHGFDLLQRLFLVDGDTSPRFMTIAAALRMSSTSSRNVVTALDDASVVLESAARGDQVRLETDMNVASALPWSLLRWLHCKVGGLYVHAKFGSYVHANDFEEMIVRTRGLEMSIWRGKIM